MIKKEDFENFKEQANNSFSALSKKVENLMKVSNLRFKKASLTSAVYKMEAKIGSLIVENKNDLPTFIKSDELNKLFKKAETLNKKIAELEKEIKQG